MVTRRQEDSEGAPERSVATGKEHLGGRSWRIPWCITSRREGVDHVVDICGAGTLEQSLKAARDEGIISIMGFPYNLSRIVQI